MIENNLQTQGNEDQTNNLNSNQQVPTGPVPQEQNKFIFYKTPWFYITLILITIGFLFGLTMSDGSMPGEVVMFGLGIELIILIAATISIFRNLKFFSMKLLAFVCLFLLTLGLGLGANFAGAYVQILQRQAVVAMNNVQLDKEYEVWKNALSNKITVTYSSSIEAKSTNKIGLYKSVSNGSKFIFNFLTSNDEIKPVDSTINGTPVYTDFNNALAISRDNDVEIFNYSLGKKVAINLQAEEGQRLSGGTFSDDSSKYQAKIEYTGTVGQSAVSSRSVFVVINMTDQTFKLVNSSEVAASEKTTQSAHTVDARNLSYDNCLGAMHGTSQYTEQLQNDFDYHYDYIYNTRSGGENAVTISDSKFYYFTALDKSENTAIFKMDKQTCLIASVFTPEKSGLSAGKIRSMSFLSDGKIIFSINPINNKDLEVYIYNLSNQTVKKVGIIQNTEIFELVNNTFLNPN
ncbi:MAG: hypothetical protein WC536_04165 [Patescibacteria group bacterium]